MGVYCAKNRIFASALYGDGQCDMFCGLTPFYAKEGNV